MTAGSYRAMLANVLSARSLFGRAWGVRRALRPLAATVVLAAGIVPAIAQTSPPMNPSQRPALAPLATKPVDKDAARQEASDERIAALLLSEAREELEFGELRNARRRLEVLVTRFAATSVGSRARRLLEQLALIDGVPMPPMPKGVVPIDTETAASTGTGQIAARTPGSGLLETDFSASGGDRVFFADGSDDVGGRGRRVLREKAAWLQRYPQVFLRIEGYADDAGGDEMNSAIALRRAESVRNELMAAGLAATRMHIAVFGRELPLSTCSSVECAAQNRRVVLVLTDARGTRLSPAQQASNGGAPAPGVGRSGTIGRRDR
jgi:peptidoglycan-associated lipoprotein